MPAHIYTHSSDERLAASTLPAWCSIPIFFHPPLHNSTILLPLRPVERRGFYTIATNGSVTGRKQRKTVQGEQSVGPRGTARLYKRNDPLVQDQPFAGKKTDNPALQPSPPYPTLSISIFLRVRPFPTGPRGYFRQS